MPACPAIDCPGKMVARKSRFGKTFYSCSTFPDCDVIVNQLEQLSEKYANHPRTAYVKKAKAGKGRGKTKEKAPAKEKKSKRASPTLPLSPQLAAIVGANEMGRGEVIKKVWDYIKSNGLQDDVNKRIIKPDAALAKVFGSSEPIDMFKMAGLLSPHMKK